MRSILKKKKKFNINNSSSYLSGNGKTRGKDIYYQSLKSQVTWKELKKWWELPKGAVSMEGKCVYAGFKL